MNTERLNELQAQYNNAQREHQELTLQAARAEANMIAIKGAIAETLYSMQGLEAAQALADFFTEWSK